ncbi:MAG: S-methyl-5'-thioadenosine phosphorylase [Akkermansiaceae bacterium]|nr:S-methyl-5'-thioadenosine phosphorylase [Armatimonadota bacterium]
MATSPATPDTQQSTPSATVGVFGGSGFYSFLTGDVREVKIDTPYGPPSDAVTLAGIGGKTVAFLPRHGRNHTIPPHKINYRANLWAMKSLGVTDIIGPNACGSLQPHVKPGDFVICDQFVDRTTGRADTFYDGPIVTHVSAAEPYCPLLRKHAIESCRAEGITVHERGTVVVINGPRFSTRSESLWFGSQGWEVINMTQYPEMYLARELEMSYVNISLITDFDAGLIGEDHPPVTNDEVLAVFTANLDNLRNVLRRMVETLPDTSPSPARSVLSVSRFEKGGLPLNHVF